MGSVSNESDPKLVPDGLFIYTGLNIRTAYLEPAQSTCKKASLDLKTFRSEARLTPCENLQIGPYWQRLRNVNYVCTGSALSMDPVRYCFMCSTHWFMMIKRYSLHVNTQLNSLHLKNYLCKSESLRCAELDKLTKP